LRLERGLVLANRRRRAYDDLTSRQKLGGVAAEDVQALLLVDGAEHVLAQVAARDKLELGEHPLERSRRICAQRDLLRLGLREPRPEELLPRVERSAGPSALLEQTQAWLALPVDADSWLGRLYQSANRLAHLWLTERPSVAEIDRAARAAP